MLEKCVEIDGGEVRDSALVVEEAEVRVYRLTSVFDDPVILDGCDTFPYLCRSVERTGVSSHAETSVLGEVDTSQVVVAVTISARELEQARLQPCQYVKAAHDDSRLVGMVVSPCIVSMELFRIQPGFDASSGGSAEGTSADAYRVYDVCRAFQESVPQDIVMLLALELVQSGVEIVVGGVAYVVPRVFPRESSLGVVIQSESGADAAPNGLVTSQVLELETVSAGLLPTILSLGCEVVTVRDMSHDSGGAAFKPILVRSLMARDTDRALCNGSTRPWTLRRPELGEFDPLAYKTGDAITIHQGSFQGSCGVRSMATAPGTDSMCRNPPGFVGAGPVGVVKVLTQRLMLAAFLWVVWDEACRKLRMFRCCDHDVYRPSINRN